MHTSTAHPEHRKRQQAPQTEKKRHEITAIVPKVVTNKIDLSKKTKASGPDIIASNHLLYLDDKTIKVSTEPVSITLNSSIIPQNWKLGRNLPLLETGKSKDETKSCRLISLLSPAAELIGTKSCWMTSTISH